MENTELVNYMNELRMHVFVLFVRTFLNRDVCTISWKCQMNAAWSFS